MEEDAPSNIPIRRIVVGVAVLAAVGLAGGYGVAMRAKPKPQTVSLGSQSSEEKKAKRVIFVHVAGAVVRPGLYELSDGARVDEAVRKAGGSRPDADLDALNLAAKVKDGDKVLVPGPPAEGEGQTGGSNGSGLLNLNTATATELEELPGIGPALAGRIVAYREQHGGFQKIDDLLDVPGIGPAKLDEIRGHATV